MQIPKSITTAVAVSVSAIVAPLGLPKSTIDGALAAMFDELNGKGTRSITDAQPLDRVLSPAQTAALIGRSTKTVRELCKRGKIRAVKCGANGQRASGYSEKSVRNFIEGTAEKEVVA